ncbi:MAG: ribosome maturation factor RimM [Acholeplasmatales bacterium]|jgi:16S rRNA processing protein RimM|nr:ribosome maturation factor RimM [Acholeplasmatales bacterium]
MYEIGIISNTHGIKGELTVINKSDFNRFFVGATMYTIIKEQKLELTVEHIRVHQDKYLILFKGYSNINDVLFLKGCKLYNDTKLETPRNEYYYEDLLNKKVFLEDKTLIGITINIIEVPQGHILEIELLNKQKKLVPFVKEFVKRVLKTKIVIAPIDGLL